MRCGKRLLAGTAVALAGVILAGCTPAGTSIKGVLSSQQEGVWVTGEGKVSVAPDIVSIRLDAEAQDDTVSLAQERVSAAMTGVTAALIGQGVAARDIQTLQFSIRQITRFDRDTEEEVVVGYRVTNRVAAKIRDVDRAGLIIDAAVEAGGDLLRIDSISFAVDDPSIYYDNIRQEAMEDARDKAEQLAELGGIRLGKPTLISESGPSAPPAPVAFEAAARFADEATSISPGDIDITLTVQVVYSIR